MKKTISIFIVIGVLFSFLVGCNIQSKKPKEEGTSLEFIILDEDEVPEKLQQRIDQEKQKPFQLSFSDNKKVYIAIGYGEQSTGGYSIKVHGIEQQPDYIHVTTELIPPKKGETVTKVMTYPYIVIQMKDSQLPIKFETIS